MATVKKTFAVKVQTLELDVENNVMKTQTVSLGENLTWQDAIKLRKANKGSYIHPENRKYPAKKTSKAKKTSEITA